MKDKILLDDPWAIDPSDFPLDGTRHDRLIFLLHYAVLAPSVLGTEAWLLHVAEDSVELRVDLARKLPITDPQGRELIISCGAALLNLQLAAASYRQKLAVAIFPDERRPEVVAKATLHGEVATARGRHLRDAMTKRRTNRGAFRNQPLPPDLPSKLMDAAHEEGGVLSFLSDPEARKTMLRLAAEASRQQLALPTYRRELSLWVQKRLTEARDQDSEARRRLGLEPPRGSGATPEPLSRPELDAPKAAGLARMMTTAGRDRMDGSRLLALLATDADNKENWLMAGRSLQRVLLVAAAEGVSASYMNAAIETEKLRPQVAHIFKTKRSPQIMLQLGIGEERPPTPRRPMNEVVQLENGE